MKTLVAVLTLLAMMLVGCWLSLNLWAKTKYDKARQDNSTAYAVTPMDPQTATFLAEVQGNWICKADDTNGPDSDVVKLAGMAPSVRNLINVFNYQMPPYRWFSPSQNRKAAELNLIKAKFMPISLDQRWHLSADKRLALLLCKSNAVYLYRDEAGGLRATLYVKRKGEVGNPDTPASGKEKTQ